MANNDLAFRFTEENYASKTEVMKALNTSLVDNIWNNILAYRKNYFTSLNLHTFNGSEYVICACTLINSKTANLEMKSLRIMREAGALNEVDFNKLDFYMNISLLKEIAQYNHLDNSDIRMRSILKSEVKSLDESNSLLPRYINALKYIKRHYLDTIDMNFIHTLHKFLIDSDDTSFRHSNDNAQANRVLIDRIYTSSPINLIEPLLNELIVFINNNNLSPIIRSYIVYYYFKMIKPFDRYSSEVAILLAKALLAHESMGEIAALLPLEKILNDNVNEENRLFTEVQKYNDVTYFIRYALDFNERINDELINYIVNFKTQNIKEEYYQIDNKEEEVKDNEVQKEDNNELYGQIAINFIPNGLDEKEAAKLEVHLLELDPSLKKKEARFYARHCTLGKSYTIQQFKKYNNVAYETARTSMDHLAELGYYRKEQVKNKFIYSPINRR